MNDQSTWNEYFKSRNLCRNCLVERRHRPRILGFIDFFATLPATLSILDVGCGQGLYLEFLRNLGFSDITGVDPSPDAVSWAEGKNLPVKQAGIYEFQPDRTFDVIIISEVLEHLDDPEKALDLAMEWLNAGGYMYLSVPVMDSISMRLRRLILKENRLSQLARIDPTHITPFSGAELVGLLTDRGLEVVETVSWENPMPKVGENILTSLANRFFPSLADYMIVVGKKPGERPGP